MRPKFEMIYTMERSVCKWEEICISGKCLAAIVEGGDDNEKLDTIFVLKINLMPLFFDIGKARAFYLGIVIHDG
jgi:hypothetical protein